MTADPLVPFLERQGFLVLDGGLATELEVRGCDLDDPLWSARALVEAPDRVRSVHRAYLEAGADVIATATYQASVPGFEARGLSHVEIGRVFREAVRLAEDERDAWCRRPHPPGRLRPLVAASVGPYGAFLADGSEYRGDYGLGSGDLEAFHRPRWEALVEAGPDLLACETIPSGAEVEVLARLASETPVFPAWISFSCPGGERLADGTPVEDAARLCDGAPGVVAVAVNCTAPHHIAGLIERLASATSKPILVYPNSGEGWDPLRKTWTGSRETTRWDRWIPEWRAAGAAGFGGCCRVGPHDITRIREVLSGL